MNTPPPLLSIVLPTYNAAACLAQALQSLADQSERDFEVVVSDGSSRDSTVELAASFKERLPQLTVLSRPDQGIYDAINRALPVARGRWVLVLGADDKLYSRDTLASLKPHLACSSAALVYGDVRVIGHNAMVGDGARYGGPFSLARLLGENICQQAICYRRDVFDRLGGFDLRFRLWADWDFAQRAFVNEPVQWVDLLIAEYAATGMSSGSDDMAFLASRKQRICRLWRRTAWSPAVPWALLRYGYWTARAKWGRAQPLHLR